MPCKKEELFWSNFGNIPTDLGVGNLKIRRIVHSHPVPLCMHAYGIKDAVTLKWSTPKTKSKGYSVKG